MVVPQFDHVTLWQWHHQNEDSVEVLGTRVWTRPRLLRKSQAQVCVDIALTVFSYFFLPRLSLHLEYMNFFIWTTVTTFNSKYLYMHWKDRETPLESVKCLLSTWFNHNLNFQFDLMQLQQQTSANSLETERPIRADVPEPLSNNNLSPLAPQLCGAPCCSGSALRRPRQAQSWGAVGEGVAYCSVGHHV